MEPNFNFSIPSTNSFILLFSSFCPLHNADIASANFSLASVILFTPSINSSKSLALSNPFNSGISEVAVKLLVSFQIFLHLLLFLNYPQNLVYLCFP